MKTTTLLVFTVLLISLKVNAQKSQGYIIINDTVSTKGIDLSFNELNPREVRSVFANKTFLSYSADDILEFGLSDKTRFVSKPIIYQNKLQNVFLELLADGEVRLLRLGRGKNSQLFLENDTLVLLKKDNYQDILSPYAKRCPKWREQITLINYSIPAIRYLVKEINTQNCERLPFTSSGLSIGFSPSEMTLKNSLIEPNQSGNFNTNSAGISAGVYIETPLWGLKNFSMSSQMNFSLDNFTETLNSSVDETRAFFPPGGPPVVAIITYDLTRDIKIEASYVTLNISPKYTIDLGPFQMYISLGVNVGKVLNFESEVISTRVFSSRTTVDSASEFVPRESLLFGAIYSTGIRFFYRFDKYAILEFSSSQISNSQPYAITNNMITLKFNL